MSYQHTAVVVIADTRGASTGTPVSLLPFWGTPLVRHSVLTALESGCGPVVVVTGEHAAYVRRAVDGLNVTTVVSDPNTRGSGEALQAGLRALGARSDLTGLLAVHAEQAMVTAPRLRELVTAHLRSESPIAAARFKGGTGLPAYVSREAFDHVFSLERGEEADRLVDAFGDDTVFVDCPEAEPTASRVLTRGMSSGGPWTCNLSAV
ncbi:MAG: NTP transferase domain-containing protein [Vicinamibacterales bacterium]